MPKIIRKDLSIVADGFHFNLEARGPSIAIMGDSGIGKSYYFRSMRARYNYFLDNSSPFLFINYDGYTPELVRDVLLKQRNKIILIDNADILIDRETAVKVLPTTDNQLVFFGRYNALFNVPNNLTAIMQKKDNTFYLRYLGD